MQLEKIENQEENKKTGWGGWQWGEHSNVEMRSTFVVVVVVVRGSSRAGMK